MGERHESKLLMVQETVEQMDMLKDWLWETDSRQRIYAAKGHKDLELHMGYLIHLKIRTFQEGPKTQKLKEPRYMGLYPSKERIRAVACSCFIRSISDFYNVVHVSALRKIEGKLELFCSRHQVISQRFYGPYHLLEIFGSSSKNN